MSAKPAKKQSKKGSMALLVKDTAAHDAPAHDADDLFSMALPIHRCNNFAPLPEPPPL